jgi:hypothetical protein
VTRSRSTFRRLWALSAVSALALALAATLGCGKAPQLSKSAPHEDEFDHPDLGPISAEGPFLGALADRVPVFRAASKKSEELGYLHAGAQVSRSKKSFETRDCPGGYYQIAPTGYVCADGEATVALDHPTLKAMALRPQLEGKLPYVYARTTKVTTLYSKVRTSKAADKGVELTGRLSRNTAMAIVGSWTAPDESREPQALGLKLNGQFVRTEDLAPAEGTSFHGVELGGPSSLPFGFVVRRGIYSFRIDSGTPVKELDLPYHTHLPLTGKFRNVRGSEMWALPDDLWVRHQDVTTIQRRHTLPDFATGDQRWIDISIVMGTLVLYEGDKPIYATLASVGRDRLGDPKTTASTARGTFRVMAKHVTRRDLSSPDEALHDAPWALELESGQWLTANPIHDRFGIEHTDGNIEVSPSDGARIFRFATPELPEGWHGVRLCESGTSTLVHVRK